ncbi:MAG TPA: M48 family metallopeptidase, partial [Bacillales bacterium]|nr:M48 family metallopeptidase [Bacillales bacterium]
MKKTAYGFIMLYVLYALAMAWYLFEAAPVGVPEKLQGTAADPSLFMSPQRLELTHEYSRLQEWLYFLSVPMEWGIYLFVMVLGVSAWMRNRSREFTRNSTVHTIFYVLLLAIVTWLASFPLHWIRHEISLSYGVSVQSFSDWMHDNVISFWINTLLLIGSVWVIYALMRRTKRWWFYAWLISIPFTLFMTFIQPVVIDPLYNDFHQMPNTALKEKILHLADRADIPADDVYTVNKSTETNALNAYVNGIGSNLRIVLWDTTLHKLSDDEIVFVMAHEIGHYVMHHLIKSVIGVIVMTLIGLYAASRLFRFAISKWGGRLGVTSP